MYKCFSRFMLTHASFFQRPMHRPKSRQSLCNRINLVKRRNTLRLVLALHLSLGSNGGDVRARPVLLVIHLLAVADFVPLFLVLLLVNFVSSKLRSLLVFDFLGKDEIEDDSNEGDDGETRLHDELDGIVEAEEGAVVTTIGENVAKPRRNHGSAETKGETCSQDEPITAGKWHGRDNSNTRDRDGGEEEGRHSTENSAGNGYERGSKLGEDTHYDQPEAASIASLAISAAGKRDDTVVLGESGHGSDSAQSSNYTVESISQDTTLDTRVEKLAVDWETGDIASRSDVANRLS